MTDLDQLTWTVARAGGFMAYGLLTASVVFGLVLGLGWRSRRWTRFVSTETHRFITLVGLLFVAIHGLALLLDPFIGFTPLEILVPGLSHYRPLYVALGIVGAYLALAIWASEYIRGRIGYAWWRRFHVLAFLAWALATVHGIGNGTDTRAPWALAIYAISVALVVGLLVLRLRPRGVLRPAAWVRPAVGGLALVAVIAAGAWTYAGPLQPGWNAIANDGHGSGSASAPSTVAVAPRAAPFAARAFTSDLSGSAQQSADGATVLVDATLASAPGGRFQLMAPATIEGGPSGSFRMRTAAGTTCVGTVTEVRRGQVGVTCTDEAGDPWTLGITLELTRDGAIVGRMTGGPSAGGGAG
jgi:DMSO/TMAO reductase YedYZ heme-binding membrane subunit